MTWYVIKRLALMFVFALILCRLMFVEVKNAFPADTPTNQEIAYRCRTMSDICDEVSNNLILKVDNCTEVMNKVYSIARLIDMRDLKCYGIWSSFKGHAYLSYKDKWGDKCLVTVVPKDKYATEMGFMYIKYDDIVETAKTLDERHTYIKEYIHGFGSSFTVEKIK